MKYYSKVSKHLVRKYVSKRLGKRIQWALSLDSGAIVNDCSGFNRIVKDIEIRVRNFGAAGGWIIWDVDFTMENGGGCSLRHCGVAPPRSRDEIEKQHLNFLNYWVTEGAASWYNLGDSDLRERYSKLVEKLEMLKAGKHICDERGLILDGVLDGI